jgi:hypothetical protein
MPLNFAKRPVPPLVLGQGNRLCRSLRRSFEHGWDKSGMAQMVSAFVAAA